MSPPYRPYLFKWSSKTQEKLSFEIQSKKCNMRQEKVEKQRLKFTIAYFSIKQVGDLS